MGLVKGILLGTGAALVSAAAAHAADLPIAKAAPVEYVKVCEAYGAGFFVVPGTDSCLSIGGRVRVDYDFRGKGYDQRTSGDYSDGIQTQTSGFYNRAYIAFDHRTPSAWGTIQTYGRLRLQSGSGIRETSSPSLEAAYVRFAGFTFGQATQPFAFMSGWAFQSNWWTGWPNGVKQLAYTFTFGGGFSATVAVTDGTEYNTVGNNSTSYKDWGNHPVYVANMRYDQSWGSFQVMGAYANSTRYDNPYNPGSLIDKDGYAIGVGASFKLPMLARGDEIQMTAVYWNRLSKLGVGTDDLRTPSAGAYGPIHPLNVSIYTLESDGWNVGAQLRHYWTPSVRSQFYGAYAKMDLNDGYGTTAKAWNLGTAIIWSPVRRFDIGLELQYLRASASDYSSGYVSSSRQLSDSNWVGRMRVERTF